jgi:hypothetical protein
VKHEVWLALPSANAENCRKNLPLWRERGYRVAVLQDGNREDVPADLVHVARAYHGWPAAVNELCKHVVPSSASIIVTGGDDMQPDPHHTAQELAEQFHERFPDGLGVMQPHGDVYMSSGTYCGSPWFGRGWVDRAYRGSGPCPAAYCHNWADNELYWVPRCMDLLWLRPDLVQYHDHFSRRGETKQEYWVRSVERHDREDVRTFIARAWLGFPGSELAGAEGEHRIDMQRFHREYRHVAEVYYASRYGFGVSESSPESRMRMALASCKREGWKAIAIYGAGSHTRACAMALADAPVRIVCIIDDHLAGGTLWNYPICSLAQAQREAVEAVILSSAGMQSRLALQAKVLEQQGIAVVPLYEETEVRSVA